MKKNHPRKILNPGNPGGKNPQSLEFDENPGDKNLKTFKNPLSSEIKIPRFKKMINLRDKIPKIFKDP